MTIDRNDATAQPDLRTYLRPIWVRKWWILGLVVATTAATYLYFDSQPRVYDASATLFVGPSEASEVLSGGGGAFNSDRELANIATLLKTRQLARRVADRLDFDGSAQTLLSSFSATPVTGSDFIQIAATAGDAERAAAIANAVAEEFVELRSARERATLQEGIRQRQEQLEALPRSRATQGERLTLQQTISQLRLALSFPTGGAEVVQEAFPPAEATSPRPRRNAQFAGILALVLGIGLAFGLERFDRRLRGVDDVRSAFDEPVLAVIPHGGDPGLRTARGNIISPDFREPFRDLLTNIELMSTDGPLRKLLVTSSVPGEGKSTVVRNLAVVMREYGLSVAVVDADLRRPTQVELFGVGGGHHTGLTTVLTGQSSLEEALVSVEVDARGLETLRRLRDTSEAADGSLGRLNLLSAGPIPANPQAVLGAQRTREVIDRLAETHDIVLIDSPPLLAVSDSVPLLTQADAVLVVARLGLATRDTARRLVEVLSRVPGDRWVGVAANDLRVGDLAYSYGYAYGYKSKRRPLLEQGDEPTRRSVFPWRRASSPAPGSSANANGRPIEARSGEEASKRG